MSRTSFILALLAIFCFSASLAQHGNVTVNITNATLLNNVLTNVSQESVQFSYDALEWNNEEANWANEWDFAENGEGEFLLSDNDGDQILIDALNSNNNTYLGDVLSQVVPGQAGGNTTIASNVGNSISFSLQKPAVVTSANQNNEAASPVPIALVVPGAAVVAVAPENAAESAPEVVVQAANNNEVEISEYVPLSVALGPAPVEVIITEENNANGTVTTTVTKEYNSLSNLSNATESTEAAEVEPENLEVLPEAAEAQPESSEVLAVAEENQAEPVAIALNSTEVESSEAAENQAVLPVAVNPSVVEGLEATEVVVTEQTNPDGSVTTETVRYYNLNSTQAENSEAVTAENSEAAAVENSEAATAENSETAAVESQEQQ